MYKEVGRQAGRLAGWQADMQVVAAVGSRYSLGRYIVGQSCQLAGADKTLALSAIGAGDAWATILQYLMSTETDYRMHG